MLNPRAGIRRGLGRQFVCFEVDAITEDHPGGFDSGKIANREQIVSRIEVFRHDQSLSMRDTVHQPEWSGNDVHLSVADQDVPVATETFNALIFVNILTIGVEEVPMTNHQVDYGIRVAIGFLGVTAKNVVNRPRIATSRRHLAVAVEARVSARVGESLELEPVARLHHPEIRITVSAADLEVALCLPKTCPESVLEGVFLVHSTLATDQRAVIDGPDTASKNQNWNHQ